MAKGIKKIAPKKATVAKRAKVLKQPKIKKALPERISKPNFHLIENSYSDQFSPLEKIDFVITDVYQEGDSDYSFEREITLLIVEPIPKDYRPTNQYEVVKRIFNLIFDRYEGFSPSGPQLWDSSPGAPGEPFWVDLIEEESGLDVVSILNTASSQWLEEHPL